MASKQTNTAPGGDEEFGELTGPMAVLARWERDPDAYHIPSSMIEQAAGTKPCHIKAREERVRKNQAGAPGAAWVPAEGHLWRGQRPGPQDPAPAAANGAMVGGEW